MNILTESLVEETVQAVQEAGACLSDPAAVHSIRTKGETDYVTNVDLAVQEFLRNRLASRITDIQFMGRSRITAAWTGTAPAGFWTRWTAPPT